MSQRYFDAYLLVKKKKLDEELRFSDEFPILRENKIAKSQGAEEK
jgi:hypothetical protein